MLLLNWKFQLSSWKIIFSILLLVAYIFLLTGCGAKYSRETYAKDFQLHEQSGKPLCINYGQQYMTVATNDSMNWKVYCYQSSPFKLFIKQVG